ncbi:hypothetical protein GV828_12840 [Flavobacterium sp. NST-5]|uniref:Uncharacterized protein n=1 Tax=Flavobacterium ichthyis TaxID=2698827 RepID=A0ABW9ZAY3_9FLAO|nr:hypothetical protein [Flavobacterium ichthyis]NBL66085.1 hypothetical protein [Flavobacterium ichthyis]
MLKYKFEIIKNSKGSNYRNISVEKPYILVGQIGDGNFDQSPQNIQMNIDALIAVQKGEKEEHIIANESGFLAIAGLEDKEQEIEEGVYIYDQFGDDSENPLYIVPIEDIIKLLQDFKKFVEDNN